MEGDDDHDIHDYYMMKMMMMTDDGDGGYVEGDNYEGEDAND